MAQSETPSARCWLVDIFGRSCPAAHIEARRLLVTLSLGLFSFSALSVASYILQLNFKLWTGTLLALGIWLQGHALIPQDALLPREELGLCEVCDGCIVKRPHGCMLKHLVLARGTVLGDCRLWD